jgi:hypothetical protein
MSNKNFKAIKLFIERVIADDSLKPEQRDTFVKVLRELEHGLKVNDLKRVRKAVEDLARQFLKV